MVRRSIASEKMTEAELVCANVSGLCWSKRSPGLNGMRCALVLIGLAALVGMHLLQAWCPLQVAPPEVNIITFITAMRRPRKLHLAGLLDPVVRWLQSRYIAFRPPCMSPASHSRRREDQLPKEALRLRYRKPGSSCHRWYLR